MAESYRRVARAEDSLPAHEIRVRRGVGIGRYLKRAWELLNGPEGKDTVIIKGVSNAVQSAVNLAELIKHRVKDFIKSMRSLTSQLLMSTSLLLKVLTTSTSPEL
jgi:hypothetical protein